MNTSTKKNKNILYNPEKSITIPLKIELAIQKNTDTNTSTNTSTKKNKNILYNLEKNQTTPLKTELVTNTSTKKNMIIPLKIELAIQKNTETKTDTNILINSEKNIISPLKTELVTNTSTKKNTIIPLKIELAIQQNTETKTDTNTPTKKNKNILTTPEKNITIPLKTETKPNNKKFKSNYICLINNLELLKNNKEFPKFEYEGPDGFKSVKFLLNKGESIRADGGSMNYMSSNIRIKTTSGSNIFGAFGRIFSGSTFFYNIFYNDKDKPGEVNFSGVIPGNIGCFYIPKGKSFNLVDDTYICSTPNIDITTNIKFGGFLLGYGLTFVNINAKLSDGLIWGESFGDIIEKKLKPNEAIKIDNGILIGFEDNVELNTQPIGGLKSTLFSDEGMVTEIVNYNNFEIKIFLQNRSKTSYIKYIREHVK